jgi:hypothetical protein
MAAKSLDKILCGAALLVLLASLAWTLNQGGKKGGANGASRANAEALRYVPANLSEFRVSTQVWAPPAAQSGGADWVYDVFTPPEIYYDLANKRFTVTPPSSAGGVVVKPVEPPFGVELVQVKQDAFRLQLVGYTGKPGNYRGTFENAVTGKTILGQAGRKIADLDLTIVSFEVKQNRTEQGTGKTVIIETEAVAQVSDDKTGEVFNLTNKSRLTKGTPIAYLKADGSSELVAYKAGAKFTVGDATFTVNSVTSETNEVVVTKESPSLKEPLTKTLTVAAPAAPAPAPTAPAPAATPAAAPMGASPFAL